MNTRATISAPATRTKRIPADERRAAIVRHATELFAEKGFVPTTMDDIAAKAAITKRTLYRYVSSKDELLFDIHDSFSGTVWQSAGQEPIDDPRESLENAIRYHVRTVADHPLEIGVYFEERKHLTAERARLVDYARGAWENHVVRIIELGITKGEFRALPARQTTQLLLGAATESYHWFDAAGPRTVEELGGDYVALFLGGLLADRQLDVLATPLPTFDIPAKNDSATNRSKLLVAATTAFAQHGYHTTSMRDLAEIADLSKGAVTYHAGYKSNLLEDIHTAAFQGGAISLRRAVDAASPTTAAQALRVLLHAHVRYIAENRDVLLVINENMRFLAPAAQKRVVKLRNEWLRTIQDVIDAGFESGDFARFDPRFITRVIVGMLNSAARWYRPFGTLKPAEFADVASVLLLNGLATAAHVAA